MIVCRLWPGVTPHPAGHPGSIWDLTLGVWDLLSAAADEYVKRAKEANDGR